jgi:hypothetical protein
MRRLRREDLRFALTGFTTLTLLVLALRTNPATRFRMELALARVSDFLADNGDCDAHGDVFKSLAYRARRDHPSQPGQDPREDVAGWTWIEEEGLLVATFYSGFRVHWDVYAYESGELRLLGSSGEVYG